LTDPPRIASRPCVACGSSDQRPYGRLERGRYLRCRNCGLICQDGSVPYDETQGRYDDQNPDWDVDCFDDLRHRFRQAPAAVLDTVRRYKPEPCAVLDVGCYRGFLLQYFAMNGWTDLTGIEPSPSASAFARDRLGLNVRTGYLADYVADPDHRRFDVVITTQVLEHTPDPAAFLRDIATVMAPGAIAVVELPHFGQPNVWFKSFRSRLGIGKPPWRHLGFPKHVFNFTARSVRLLLERTGFEILSARARSKVREHDGFLGRLFRRAKSAVGWGSTLQFVVQRRA
jgi:SAM-dependent methyltransferase